jgi:hypothetical protein
MALRTRLEAMGDALSSMFREIPAPISDLRFCLGGWRHRARKIGTGQINSCIRFEFSCSLDEDDLFSVVADARKLYGERHSIRMVKTDLTLMSN